MPSSESHSLSPNPEVKPAWMAIIGLTLFLSLFLIVGAGKLLILGFPLGSLLVGGFLYSRYPIYYSSFTWWTWFLGALIRRMIDYQSGYLTPGPWTLTPLLVTLISLMTFARHITKAHKQGGFPFILCFGSLLYSFFVGGIYNPKNRAILQFLYWLAPVGFSFHLFANWRDYPRYRQHLQKTFLWGTLIMSLYGIWQYLVAPEWERFLLRNIDTYSFGRPEPLGIRVFSTMNSPQAFSNTIGAGLILLLTVDGILPYPIASFGFLAFLLSRARSAWLGWFLGMITFIPSLKANIQMRITVSILIVTLLIVPLASIEPFSTTVNSRLESFSSIEDDQSLETRSEGYSESLDDALSQFLGKGMGTKENALGNDSGIMKILFSLGWFGTLPYLGGVLLLLMTVFQSFQKRFDAFISAAFSIAFGVFAQIGFNPIMEASIGMIFWGFLGIGMAGHKYHSYHNKL